MMQATGSASGGDIAIAPVDRTDDLEAVRSLCWAYREVLLNMDGVSVEVTDAFRPDAKYHALMQNLPHLHARPMGIILLARDAAGTPVGCGMSHALDAQTSEIKRVFVKPQARGNGVAERLCQGLVDQARQDCFKRVVLDTHRLLHSAQRLYLRLGFAPRGPYQPMPANILPELLFYERIL